MNRVKVPFTWDGSRKAWMARCSVCKELVDFISFEAKIRNRLRIPMTVLHDCSERRV